MSDEKAALNTDREIWREREGDYYADSIHVTEGGGIGMNCGGKVIVKPIREWFALAVAPSRSAAPPSDSQILDWMIFHGATVICTRDGERCWVEWYPSDPEESKQTTHSTYQEKDARDALREAIRREEAHEYR